MMSKQEQVWKELAIEQGEDAEDWSTDEVITWAMQEIEYAKEADEWNGITERMIKWVDDSK